MTRAEILQVKTARQRLEQARERLNSATLAGTQAHHRKLEELAVQNAERSLEIALKQQATEHRIADRHEGELAKLAEAKSERIKASYLVDHPETTSDQYAKVRPEVEARYDAQFSDANRQAMKAKSSYRSAL